MIQQSTSQPITRRRKAVCPYCGVGCRVTSETASDRITRILADKADLPNRGMLCQKGALLGDEGIWDESRRLTQPMLRTSRDTPLMSVTWNQAAQFIAERIHNLRESHGKDAVGFYGSGQCDTEASYLFNKLFKGHLSTNHIDSNSRLCMSSAVSAYVMAFGADAPPTCYDDIQHTDLALIIGANMSANHPVLMSMLVKRRSVSDGKMRIIAVDPRRTATADLADDYIPVAPGGDVALLSLVARRLLQRGIGDNDFIERSTSGFEEYRRSLDALDDNALLQRAGVTEDHIQTLTDAIANSTAAISFYCQGMNQSVHGVDNNLAIINLHLLTGHVGRPGAGPFSLTGQPNAMGGREVGYLAHQLPGYRLVSNPEHRQQIEEIWQLPADSLNAQPGPATVELFDSLTEGSMKGIWIACTNPAASMPDANRVCAGLEKAELVIHQDCYHPTETGLFADVLLPAAQWGEKTGTMTNSERLVSRSEKLYDPPGQAMPDWWIAARVGRALGFTGFDYVTSDEVWNEIRLATQHTPCDCHGMTNERLHASPLHWPCPDASHPGTQRRYTDGTYLTDDQRARFHALAINPTDEHATDSAPLILTTGRVASQWHTRTRTGPVERLTTQEPEPFLEIHPTDAARLGITDQQPVRITGMRGSAEMNARITTAIRPGTVFAPFHWGTLHHPLTNINAITNPAIDPISKQPALKLAAVSVTPLPRKPKSESQTPTAEEAATC